MRAIVVDEHVDAASVHGRGGVLWGAIRERDEAVDGRAHDGALLAPIIPTGGKRRHIQPRAVEEAERAHKQRGSRIALEAPRHEADAELRAFYESASG